MPTINELISELTPEQKYEFSTNLIQHLYDLEWCNQHDIDYYNLPKEHVELAKWATYREIVLSK